MTDLNVLFDSLKTHLLDLLDELRPDDIGLIIGGGYGLYLKQVYVREARARTLISIFPPARSTNDLDLFLCTEVLSAPEKAQAVADALNRLGYTVIEQAKYYQFVKKIADLYEVKIDLLTRYPPAQFLETHLVRIKKGDERRIKPGQEGIRLHAHRTDEAIAIEDKPLSIPLKGFRSNGEPCEAVVCLPQAFAYALMKLFAFRDQNEKGWKDHGRHHALDLYNIVAMMTEEEYLTARSLRTIYHNEPTFVEGARIVQDYFSDVEAMGILRLREHPLYFPDMDLREFMGVLKELFS